MTDEELEVAQYFSILAELRDWEDSSYAKGFVGAPLQSYAAIQHLSIRQYLLPKQLCQESIKYRGYERLSRMLPF
jgi:hypothetical protein